MASIFLARLRKSYGPSAGSRPIEDRGGALSESWPKLKAGATIAFFGACLAGRLALSAKLMTFPTSVRLAAALLAAALVFGLVEELLERRKWIKKSDAKLRFISGVALPIPRPPPPIGDENPEADPSPPSVRVVGGDLPPALARGASARWTLEGDYRWRPSEERV